MTDPDPIAWCCDGVLNFRSQTVKIHLYLILFLDVVILCTNTGRAGNHFLTISAYMSMAYCCKSKVVSSHQDDAVIFVFRTKHKSSGGSQFMSSQGWGEVNGSVRKNAIYCPPRGLFW